MINSIYTFNDIIDTISQEKLLNYIKSDNIKWNFLENVTGNYNGNNLSIFPAKVHTASDMLDGDIIDIIHKIESNVADKIGLSDVKNYRYKINWTRPLGFEYNPQDLMHVDNVNQHIAMIYYINDASGDTCIYDNLDGNTTKTCLNNLNSIDLSKFKLLKKVEPKMGRVVVFNGMLHHHASYPEFGDRFILNFNFMASHNTKSVI